MWNMIVKTYITISTGHSDESSCGHGIDRLRWLCEALIGDDILCEHILIAAQAQAGLNRQTANDPLTTLWAGRLVIKDCIAAVRPGTSNDFASRDIENMAAPHCTRCDRSLHTYLRMPTYALRFRLRRLAALPRFVYVLKEIEGLSFEQIGILLNLSQAQCGAAFFTAVDALCNFFASTMPLNISRGTNMRLPLAEA
jgi:hypothetical protein